MNDQDPVIKGAVKRKYKQRTNCLINDYVHSKNKVSSAIFRDVTNIVEESSAKRKYKPRLKKSVGIHGDGDVLVDGNYQVPKSSLKRNYTPRVKPAEVDGVPATIDNVKDYITSPLSNITNVGNSKSPLCHNVFVSSNNKPSKFSNTESSRKLFTEDMSGENAQLPHDDYETIEHSVISGLDSEDELFSEEEENDDPDDDEQTNSPEKEYRIPVEYATLGGPTAVCSYCNAYMWKEERVNKNVVHGTPKFALCCSKGTVRLPKPLPTPPHLLNLYNDEEKGPTFVNLIRVYNSMFSFTSTGGNVDHSINNGGAPYVYRLNGQNHHVFGSLLPADGEPPKFCQLYIYDTTNEVNNRIRWRTVGKGDEVDVEVVQGLMDMLDETNELVQKFRMSRDRYEDGEVVDLEIELKSSL